MIYNEQQRFRTSAPRMDDTDTEDGGEILFDEELDTSPTSHGTVTYNVPRTTNYETLNEYESPDTTKLFPPNINNDQNDDNEANVDDQIAQQTSGIPTKYYVFGAIALISVVIIGFIIYKMNK